MFFVTPLLRGNLPKVHEHSGTEGKPLCRSIFSATKGIVKHQNKNNGSLFKSGIDVNILVVGVITAIRSCISFIHDGLVMYKK